MSPSPDFPRPAGHCWASQQWHQAPPPVPVPVPPLVASPGVTASAAKVPTETETETEVPELPPRRSLPWPWAAPKPMLKNVPPLVPSETPGRAAGPRPLPGVVELVDSQQGEDGSRPKHWRPKATASGTQNHPSSGSGASVDSATPPLTSLLSAWVLRSCHPTHIPRIDHPQHGCNGEHSMQKCLLGPLAECHPK